MIVVKIFAGLVIFLTVAVALLGQFFEPYNPNASENQIEASDAEAVIGTAALVDVQRRPGAVICKFDPVTDNPQQFAADYLFAELFRQDDVYTLSARVAVPYGGYTVTYGAMSMAGNQVVLDIDLKRPAGQALEMIDTVNIKRDLRFPAAALTLRAVLRRDFAWGPDAIVCSIMRPVTAAPPAPTPTQPFITPAPAPAIAPPAAP